MDKTKVESAFSFHQPTPEQVDSMERIRETARELAYVILDSCPNSADRTDALRKLREVVMTANASIVLEGLV